MIGRLFRRTSREDELFAEAQALIDDGLELAFVLDLYPEDADWLAPLLDTGIVIGESFAVEEPSYYFEASLKNRFVEAGLERAARAATPVREPVAVVPAGPAPRGFLRLQGVVAGSTVAVVLGGLSVLTLGVVTSGDSVPGDWNYAFKLAGERIEYSLSSGDERTNIQIRHTMVRIEEFQRLAREGKVSEKNVEDVRKELEDLTELTTEEELDPVQQASVKAASESASAVFESAKQTAPELTESLDEASSIAASLGGGITGVSAPTATPTAVPTSTATTPTTPSVTPTAGPNASPSASASPSVSPSPETSATVVPATEEPGDEETEPAATADPDAEAEVLP